MRCKKCKMLRHLIEAIYDLFCRECKKHGCPNCSDSPCEPCPPCPDHPAISVNFLAKFNSGLSVKGTHMSIMARIDQVITLSPGFTDAKGNVVAAADLGSVPVWTVSDEGIATVAPSADGMTAVVSSTGTLGTVQVNMVVDADPDEDVEDITGVVEITFKAGKAAFVTLSGTTADAPVTPPAPPVTPTDPTAPPTDGSTTPPTDGSAVPPTDGSTPVDPNAPVDPTAVPATDPTAPPVPNVPTPLSGQ